MTNVYAFFTRLTDIQRISELYVFLDEKPTSINDGLFELVLPMQSQCRLHYAFRDNPSQSHNNACGLGFCDGHAEMHSLEEVTLFKSPALYQAVGNALDPNFTDEQWLNQHATYPIVATSTSH